MDNPPGDRKFGMVLETGRSLGNPPHEGVTIATYINVLINPSNFEKWLEEKYSISKRQKGTIDTTYIKKLNTYNTYIKENITVYEVGNYKDILSYTTFFLPKNSKYVYTITLTMYPYGNKDVDPPDSYFLESYKQIVSTFKFTN